jgi:hypothetical protein
MFFVFDTLLHMNHFLTVEPAGTHCEQGSDETENRESVAKEHGHD